MQLLEFRHMPWLKGRQLYLVLCKLHRSLEIVLMRMLTYVQEPETQMVSSEVNVSLYVGLRIF